jgi:alkanesulfonate monooxygenase SsuD/methylene tetrahydromethanopterin reductase-like flavin-dependent oxidoreductase (luciferase family)
VECANRLAYYRQYAEQACGWSPRPADLGIARELYVVPTRIDIDQRIREVFEGDRVHAFTHRAAHARLRAIDAERFKVRSYDYLTAVDSPFQGAAMTVEGRCSGQFLAGNPDAIMEEIIAQQKATGAGVLVVRSELGSISLAEALEGLELFAREVLPVVQRL